MEKVSVIVPCYNHELFIRECINSILNQNYPNIELIVIDDGSKDTCPKIIQELGEKHGFTFVLKENQL